MERETEFKRELRKEGLNKDDRRQFDNQNLTASAWEGNKIYILSALFLIFNLLLTA